ncbi:MAG: AmmeMemoRadiSam system radical SAM enzyme [bacterium]
MIEALVYKKLKNGMVKCGICQRQCVISDKQTGFCLTKFNNDGKLFAINYGLIQGTQIDPIEKKPFYHFQPGKLVPSVGSFGCNFHCKQCLNSWCSWGEHATLLLRKAKDYPHYQAVDSKQLINETIKGGYRGIAFTYNEPVIWSEFVLDTAKFAKAKKLFTLFITNGSWTKETLDKIGPHIDAANIDFKGFSNNTYDKMGGLFKGILDSAKYAKEKYGIFLEITTLVIPGINDSEKELKAMARWIVKHLGAKTPWHLSRFEPLLTPDKQFRKIPATSIESLKAIADNGRKAGLEFVYIWAPEDSANNSYSEGNTYCPKCKKMVITRNGWLPKIIGVNKNGHCSFCDENINVVFNTP